MNEGYLISNQRSKFVLTGRESWTVECEQLERFSSGTECWLNGFMGFITTSSTLSTNRCQGGVWLLPLVVGSLLIISPTDSISVFELPVRERPATRPVPRNNSQASGVNLRGLDTDLLLCAMSCRGRSTQCFSTEPKKAAEQQMKMEMKCCSIYRVETSKTSFRCFIKFQMSFTKVWGGLIIYSRVACRQSELFSANIAIYSSARLRKEDIAAEKKDSFGIYMFLWVCGYYFKTGLKNGNLSLQVTNSKHIQREFVPFNL